MSAVLRRMAQAMADRLAAGRCTTRADLLATGFSADPIDRHGPKATWIAIGLARRQGLDLSWLDSEPNFAA